MRHSVRSGIDPVDPLANNKGLLDRLSPRAVKSHLWDCAEILRGSAVDRTDWKAYILPLLFFKRICDVWDEEAEEATLVYGEALVRGFSAVGEQWPAC